MDHTKINPKFFLYALVLVFFSSCAFWLGSTSHKGNEASPLHQHKAKSEREIAFWTCSMHPNIRLKEQGKCPICFMDLTPLYVEKEENKKEGSLNLGEYAKKLAQVETTAVIERPLHFSLSMPGKVEYDETKISYITLWTPGNSRLNRMFINYTGASFKRGDPVVEVYSPDLISSQGEYLSAYNAYVASQKSSSLQKEIQSNLQINLNASKRKLIALGMKLSQIEELEKKGVPDKVTTLYSNQDGTIIARLANEGEWQSQGMPLYKVADISQVWIFLQAYESDMAWIKLNQMVKLETDAYPGEFFEGKIAFIHPFLDEKTRTVLIRIQTPNPENRLKPGMFVRASINIRLNEKGEAIESSTDGNHPKVLSIPFTSPLLTGKRAIVYVEEETVIEEQGEKKSHFYYTPREVVLGPRAGDYYLVLQGLKEGEKVVVQGAFKIDSSLQILGKPSMMQEKKLEEEKHPIKETKAIIIKESHDFHNTMKPLLQVYWKLTEELSQDSSEHLQHILEEALKIVQGINITKLNLDGESRKEMEKILSILKQSLSLKKYDIASVRHSLIEISNALSLYLEKFGHKENTSLYKIFCPMANDDKGASWWQRSKDIANPYFGSEMFSCGVVKKQIAPTNKSGE